MEWPTLQERWEICESYLQNRGATDQSKQSFNAFIDRELRHCIYEHFNIDIQIGVDLKKKFKVTCTNVVIQKPICLNNDIDITIPENYHANAALCRLLRGSFVSAVYLTLAFNYNGKHEQCNNMLLCYIPIMTGSKISLPHKSFNICDDGYFVLGGSEKCIVHQEKKIDRAILVHNKKCHFYMPTNNVVWWLEQEQNKNILIRSKVGSCDLAIIFADADVQDDQIFPIEVREKKIEWQGRSFHERLHKFKTVFPQQTNISIVHMFNTNENNWMKQLLYMSKSLDEKINLYNRDHLGFKRVEGVSELLLCVARKSIKRVVNSFQKKILNFMEKYPNKSILKGISRALDSRIVTEAFFYSLGTGNWPSSNGMVGFRTGVCQQRSNYNFSSILSQSRRIKTGDEKRSIIQQREVRGETFGYLCPYDTSEGKSCGINKHFATLTTLSIEFAEEIIVKIVHEKKYLNENIDLNQPFLVFINGVIQAQAPTKQALIQLKNELKQYKRMGVIDRGVSVVYNFNRLEIRSDAGRLLRPLFILKNLIAHLTTTTFRCDFESLLKGGIIEFVDTMEEESLIIAADFKPKYLKDASHCELHPSLMLSMNTNANNPFCNHNQGPRLVSYSVRKTMLHQLTYPLDIPKCHAKTSTIRSRSKLQRFRLQQGTLSIVWSKTSMQHTTWKHGRYVTRLRY